MKIQIDTEAIVLKGKGVTVSVAEHQGKVEVVVKGKDKSVRVLNDKDGLHVGRAMAVRLPSARKRAMKKR